MLDFIFKGLLLLFIGIVIWGIGDELNSEKKCKDFNKKHSIAIVYNWGCQIGKSLSNSDAN